ncbi:tetratricopeptide repeat protein 34 [Tachyglossus aculeatus]|uniref:tetratricopeptide repeat protein 34 n=1 Tax=Tachyglossus aculeatus TaxID=9261 RepID=UPI0018F2D14F|nr:tetratricopeptide repeat protein 34 [Tachyglossus aculeatus]
MPHQELPARLCQEGAWHAARSQLPLATAFYLAAFSCRPALALKRVRALGEEREHQVVATLEAWGGGETPIPSIHCDRMAVVSLTPELAATFLATLRPHTPAPSPQAFPIPGGGGFVLSQGGEPLLLPSGTFGAPLPAHRPGQKNMEGRPQDDQVAARALGDPWACSKWASFLLSEGRWEECVTICTQALGDGSKVLENLGNGPTSMGPPWDGLVTLGDLGDGPAFLNPLRDGVATLGPPGDYMATPRLPGEVVSSLLVHRAAAHFLSGLHSRKALEDLQEAFMASPRWGRRHLEEAFSPRDVARIEAQAQEAVESGFSAFREEIRSREEPRRDSGPGPLPGVARTLRFLLHVAPGPERARELNVRLADCLLLAGDWRDALALCGDLLLVQRATYRSTLLALRGFCTLRAGDPGRALEDFQAVVGHEAPHPVSCVRALCGRGLLRVLAGSPYLGARDYITACWLKRDEAVLTVKAYVPWNQRGLLLTVLQEEGHKMLQKKPTSLPARAGAHGKKAAERDDHPKRDGDVSGVHQLATLLMELDEKDEGSRLLCADALYLLGRLEESHKVLLGSLSRNARAPPVLARLALLQMRRGFLYDSHQLIRKVIQLGDTSCLQPILEVFPEEDRMRLQAHCHARALVILDHKEGDTYIKEAVAYLSLAIIASGGQAIESLLTRARCYGRLGQKRTAVYDFNAVLSRDSGNVAALCGRAFMLLVLNQQKEALRDLTLALKLDASSVVPEILTLKPEAQALICHGLHAHCRAALKDFAPHPGPTLGEPPKDLLALGRALTTIGIKRKSGHFLYADVLIAVGRHEEAIAHLREALGPSEMCGAAARARLGWLQLKKRDARAAAHHLEALAGQDPQQLAFLLDLMDDEQRQSLVQAAAAEGNILDSENRPEEALGYWSLAVSGSRGQAKFLRQRAACLAHMKEFGQALADLDEAIKKHGPGELHGLAEDYCTRGLLQLTLSDEEAATEAYIKALQLQRSVALGLVAHQPGPKRVAQVFYQVALRHVDGHRYEDAWKVVEFGLLVDQNHGSLKKLRARIKREVAGCSVH